ncbi:MAG: peptidylprolyl isomerase [Bacteroidales bacterium]|nr:peptidylprolyl isomerase [Bacteroidales bacterium]
MNKLRSKAAVAGMAAMLCLPLGAQAQDDGKRELPVMEVGGEKIYMSEFMRDYNSALGAQMSRGDLTTQEKREAFDEYVQLYAIFRAKLADAHRLGLDTTAGLRKELAHYRRDLAAPYLIDSAELRRLMAEAYERNHYSLRAAHILVQVPFYAGEADTQKYLDKANELYRRITEGGEDFHSVAASYYSEQRPGAPYNANEGELGYFSVFDMVYPFENAAYALKVGEVSRPVRTRYGYHIIKLLDKVEGLYGRVTMAHIWLQSPDSTQRKGEIGLIYNRLQEGVSFAQAARQSDDKSTANNGGIIPDASLTQLPVEYIHKLATLQPGEYSRPFFTQYGWHIIQLVKRDTLPPANDLENFYRQRMARDPRGENSRKKFAASCRAKYVVVDRTTTPAPLPKGRKARKGEAQPMQASLAELMHNVGDTVYQGRWTFDASLFTDTTALVVAQGRRYTSLDVARYIDAHQKKSTLKNIEIYVHEAYDNFVDSVAIDCADRDLERDYPDFARIVDEYRRGLIIFNYNDTMIWRKAVQDTLGFASFYARESVKKSLDNPEDSVFFFHPRARLTLVDIASDKVLKPSAARKLAEKNLRKKGGSSALREALKKKITDGLKVSSELVEQTKQSLLAADEWQEGVYIHTNDDGSYRMVVVEEVLPRSLKGMVEARGYYLNSWQNEVEQELNMSLRRRYNIKINNNALQAIPL